MLFVNDHEPQPAHGREYGRAGPDDDVHVAATDALPLVVALAVGQPAVLDGDALAEGRAEQGCDRRRQRDFGHEQEHTAAALAHVFREAEVQLGLAAARDAVQQDCLKRLGRGKRAQLVIRGRLLAR